MNNQGNMSYIGSSMAFGSTTLTVNIRALWKARFFILLFTLICSVLCVLVAYFILPSTFKSSTIILVPRNSSSSLSKTQTQHYKTSYNALIHFLKSEYLQHKLQTDHGFEVFFSGSENLLSDSLVMDGDGATGLITISSISSDPQLVHSNLRIILQELNEFFLTVYETGAMLAKTAITRRLEEIKASIEELEVEHLAHKNVDSALLLELQTQKRIYQDLRMQSVMVDINDSTQAVRFKILKEPTVPNHEYGPKRLQLSIVSAASAFLCSILIVFIRNGLRSGYCTSHPLHLTY